MRQRLLFFCLVLVAASLNAATPASAGSNYPQCWGCGPAPIGYCGVRSGGAVRAVQAMLWAGHWEQKALNYSSMEYAKRQVDGVWDNTDDYALRMFQNYHGLGVDGCAGYYTLSKMQDSTHFKYQYWRCCSSVYMWKEPAFPENIGFFYTPGNVYEYGYWRFQWFDGCYQMNTDPYNGTGGWANPCSG